MFLFLLSAIICAKKKGYRIIPVFKAYSLYPYAVVEVMYLFLQANIFLHNYNFIKYTPIINSIYLYTLILPVLVYQLFKPSIYGSSLIIIGTVLNKFVMTQNGGKMPVYATLSKLTGYYDMSAIQSVDNIHIIGNGATNFKFLTDFIDTGCSILSIGDLLIHSFVFIIIYFVIKEVNLNPKILKKKEKDTYYGTI